MKDEIVTPENLTKELLHTIYSAAFMDTSWDDDGDLTVSDGLSCFAFIDDDKERIRFIVCFNIMEGTPRQQRLELVNRINSDYLLVRASLTEKGNLLFDYQIFVKGGICQKNIVLATKRFLSIPRVAIREIEEQGNKCVI